MKKKSTKKTRPTYFRHSILEDLSILKFATNKTSSKNRVNIELNGETINMSSLRLLTFKEKGVDCVACSAKGKFLALEKNYTEKGYHINLYGMDSNGNEVLMTKDHILAKSNGGSNNISNMQTMCTVCNGEKGCS